MTDVDAFPMNKALFDPIKNFPKMKIWVYHYDQSIDFGYTFNMKFTGMRSKMWKSILNGANSFQDLVSNFGEKLELENRTLSYDHTGTWTFDQLILTRAILDSKLCFFPSNNLLWSKLNMDPILMEKNSDIDTCYHGKKLSDCNSSTKHNKMTQCFWHFSPDDKK